MVFHLFQTKVAITQKIPPITSVNDNNVNSAAGIALEPIEYKIQSEDKLILHVMKIK